MLASFQKCKVNLNHCGLSIRMITEYYVSVVKITLLFRPSEDEVAAAATHNVKIVFNTVCENFSNQKRLFPASLYGADAKTGRRNKKNTNEATKKIHPD